MGLLLSKILTLLATPIGITFLIGLVAIILFYLHKQTLSRIAIFSAFGWLWLSSTALFSNTLYESLERVYPPVPVAKLPQADAIVVLGGGVKPIASPNEFPDFNAAGDRLLHGARLYKAGKAKKIILSGGQVFPNEAISSEAQGMKALLMSWGVDEADIVVEGLSRTTRENAVETQKVLVENSWNKILLVTSAAHMPRSMCSFDKVDVNAIPAPTDYEVTIAKSPLILRTLPNSAAQDLAARGMKEYLGRWVYQWRGWC